MTFFVHRSYLLSRGAREVSQIARFNGRAALLPRDPGSGTLEKCWDGVGKTSTRNFLGACHISCTESEKIVLFECSFEEKKTC